MQSQSVSRPFGVLVPTLLRFVRGGLDLACPKVRSDVFGSEDLQPVFHRKLASSLLNFVSWADDEGSGPGVELLDEGPDDVSLYQLLVDIEG